MLSLSLSTSAAAASSEHETTILPNKWYVQLIDDIEETSSLVLYSGPSPISLSDFNPEDIKSESYVMRVIDSFSNNG